MGIFWQTMYRRHCLQWKQNHKAEYLLIKTALGRDLHWPDIQISAHSFFGTCNIER